MNSDQEEQEQLLSVAEVAAMKGVSRKTVYGWTYRRPELPVERRGHRIFIKAKNLGFHSAKEKSLDCASNPKEEYHGLLASGTSQCVESEDLKAARVGGELEIPRSTSSGQRELVIRQRYGLGIAVLFVPILGVER